MVVAYKNLARVERDFRSIKIDDLDWSVPALVDTRLCCEFVNRFIA